MKKSTVKLTSTILMLSLIGTSLNAATSLDENIAATRITKLFRLSVDRKLNKISDEISKEAREMGARIGGNLVFLERELREKLDSLSYSSDFKSTVIVGAFLSQKTEGLDLSHLLQEYQAYLDKQISEGSPIKRQLASIMKARIESKMGNEATKLVKMRDLLKETITSHYPKFQWRAYSLLSEAERDSGNNDQALNYLYMGLICLPKSYHADIYDKLANFDNSEDYKPKKERYLRKIIKIGTPKEKAEALEKLIKLYNTSNSAFYRPSDALKCYQDLIDEPQLIHLLDSGNDIHRQIVELFAFSPDEEIKNIDRAVEILDSILLKTPTAWDYSYAMERLTNLYIPKDPVKAFSLAQEALSNPNLQHPLKSYIESSLVYLYRNGPEGIKNHQEALRILEEKAAATYGENFDVNYRSNILFQLAQLLELGDDTVKDRGRAIQIYEELRENSIHQINSLNGLLYIYRYDPVHKNPAKAIECHLELVELYADQPLEKLKVLVNLLNLYDTEGEIFNPEEANNIVQNILEMQVGDSAESLEALRGLIRLLAGGTIAVRSIERNIQLYEGLLENSEFRASSLQKLSSIYANDTVHRNRPRAIEYNLELVELHAGQPIEQFKPLENLLNLYETEGDDDKAKSKSIIQSILEMQSRDSVEYLEALQRLAQRLIHGNDKIKDIGKAIQILEELCTHSNFKISNLQKLSNIYEHDPVYKNPVKLEECYLELVELYADQPLEQLNVLIRLLNLYDTEGEAFNPEEANNIVQRILQMHADDPAESLEARRRLAQHLTAWGVVKNTERTIQFHEELRGNSEFKLSSLKKLSDIYDQDPIHKNPPKAIECYLELAELYAADQPLERLKVLIRLLNLYDTEGETFNPDEANNIVQNILAMQASDSTESLEARRRLAQTLTDWSITVKNTERTIQFHEDLRGNSEFKLSSLKKLSDIYDQDPIHKNPSKAIECYLELVELYADQPIEQLNILARLLKLYIAEGEAFNSEEAKTSAHRILTDLAADPAPTLNVQVALSDLYSLHSDISTPEEIIRINMEIITRSSELEANSSDLINAHKRLIENYHRQGDVEGERTTYLSLFNCCENASIATECYQQLVKLYADQPLEQLKVLARLLKLYIAQEAAFNAEEEKTKAQSFLTSLAVDPTAYLEKQVALSDLYYLHPDLSTPEEIIHINEELTKHEELKTGSPDIINAHKRLIEVYKTQKNTQKTRETYISLLERCGNDNRVPILQEYTKFSNDFVNDPVNADIVQELRSKALKLRQR